MSLVQIGQDTGKPLDAPATGAVPEIVDHPLQRNPSKGQCGRIDGDAGSGGGKAWPRRFRPAVIQPDRRVSSTSEISSFPVPGMADDRK